VGQEIVTKARKGDQLFVEAVAKTMMGSSSPYDHEFIVKGFVFGAKRGAPGCPTADVGNQPTAPLSSTAEERVAQVA
jgi:hypothetical protein